MKINNSILYRETEFYKQIVSPSEYHGRMFWELPESVLQFCFISAEEPWF